MACAPARTAGVERFGDGDRHRAGRRELRRGPLILRRNRERVTGVVTLLQIDQPVAGGERGVDLRRRAGQHDRAGAVTGNAGRGQAARHIGQHRQGAVQHRQRRGDIAGRIRVTDGYPGDRLVRPFDGANGARTVLLASSASVTVIGTELVAVSCGEVP